MDSALPAAASKGVKRARANAGSKPPAVRTSARSGVNHVLTERKRRDRINAGFDELRLVIPTEDTKLDKAGFLQLTVDYIRNMQTLLGKAIDQGHIDALPEDAQWRMRMLLPRDALPPACRKVAAVLPGIPAGLHTSAGRGVQSEDVKGGVHTTRMTGVRSRSVTPGELAMGNNTQQSPLQGGTAPPSADLDPNLFNACLLNYLQQQQQQQQALISLLFAQCAAKGEPATSCGQGTPASTDLSAMYMQLLQQQALMSNPLALTIQPLQMPCFTMPCPTTCGMALPATSAPGGAGNGCGLDHDMSEDECVPSGTPPVRDTARPAKIRKCSSTAAVLSKPSAPARQSGLTAGRPGM